MAAKKKTRGKIKTSRKAKPKASSASDYPCPNTGKALGLAATVRRLLKEPGFAAFMRHELCLAHQGDEDAIKCIASYYRGPTKDELDHLCIAEKDKARCLACTDHLNFIDGLAWYGGAKKR